MKTNSTIALIALLAFSCVSLSTTTAFAQGTTAFTYQGQLRDGGTNANGTYTMTFKLYDAASGGNQIGSTITDSPTLANGLFTVNLDFGAGAFNGSARWLDITVQGDTLSPRVQVLPSPYAIYSSAAGSAANLSSGTWNASTGNYQTYSNVFGIFDNNSLVLGLSTNGVLVNGDLQADSVNFDGGGSISGDGQGGLNISGVIGDLSADNLTVSNLVSGSISAAGLNLSGGLSVDNLTARNLNLSGDLSADNLTASNLNLSGNINANSGNISCTNLNANSLSLGSHDMQIETYGVAPEEIGIEVAANFRVTGNINADSLINAAGVITAQNFVTSSDRNLKEKFTPIDNQEILERVASLPISRWNFKADEKTRHIGPMAQDFYAAFNVGTDDKHIATVDEDGVALAAIQGLNEKLKEKDAKIEAMEKRLADLEELIKTSAQK
jgi:hypothetical protein